MMRISRLARVAPSEADMSKLRNQMQAGYVLGLQSNFARAQKLAEFELYRGDANLINIELGRYLSVTGDEIRRAVGKYLIRSRRSSVEVKPLADEEAHPHEAPKAAPRATAPKTHTGPGKK